MSRLPHFSENRLRDGGEVVDSRVIVWLEVLGQFKNPVTSSGHELETFRRVVLCPLLHNILVFPLYICFKELIFFVLISLTTWQWV
jgi:hypothetical protein